MTMRRQLRGGRRYPSADTAAPAAWSSASFGALTPGASDAPTILALGSGGLVLTRAAVSGAGGSATVQSAAASVTVIGATADIPRVYSDGTRTGLLLEEPRTNVLQYARDMSNPFWGGTATKTSGQVGIDGTSVAYKIDVTSGNGFGETAGTNPGSSTTSTLSMWARSAAGTTAPNLNLFRSALGRIATSVTVGTTFARVALTASTDSETVTAVPVDGRDWSLIGGLAAGARSHIVDCMQRETGSGASSAIITAGAVATRAADVLKHSTPSQLLSGGRLGLLITFSPLWSSADYALNAGNLAIWACGSDLAIVNKTTRVLTVTIAGVTRTLGALPTWAALDTLEIWIAAGGGTSTLARVRVNGSTVTDLGSTTSLTAIVPGANPIYFLCNSTASTFSSVVSSISTSANAPF